MAENDTTTAEPVAPEDTGKTETNNSSEQPAGQAEQAEQANPNQVTFTDEQMKFINSQGGLEKFMETSKRLISNPPKPAENPASTPAPAQTVNQPTQAQSPVQGAQTVPKGYITKDAFAIQQYCDSLARESKYSGIATGISNGELVKEAAQMGIFLTTPQGLINDAKFRMFLDLKAAGVANTQQVDVQAQASPAPTVDYVGPGDGNITSVEEAVAIVTQNAQLKEQGLAPNPNYEAAVKFLGEKNGIAPKTA